MRLPALSYRPLTWWMALLSAALNSVLCAPPPTNNDSAAPGTVKGYTGVDTLPGRALAPSAVELRPRQRLDRVRCAAAINPYGWPAHSALGIAALCQRQRAQVSGPISAFVELSARLARRVQAMRPGGFAHR